MGFDLLIKNGRIVDGSGLPAYRGDVGIRQGRIAALGRLAGPARQVIDAEGRVVAPGFIDLHTHYDAQLFWDPLATSSCWHGVTTAVMGNCGLTLAPCKPEDRETMMEILAKVEDIPASSMEKSLPWSWETTGEYLDAVGRRLGINVACLIGHSAVRRYVMGPAASEREATPEEIARMQDVVRQGMAAGAFGFSTSLSPTHIDRDGRPVPSRFASHDEIVALGGVLREFNAGEIELVPASIFNGIDKQDRDLMVRLARESGRMVYWNEFFFTDAWRDMARFMADAHAQGARVYTANRSEYPVREFSLGRSSIAIAGLAAWRKVFMYTPYEYRLKSVRDPAVRDTLRRDVDESPSVFRPPWERIYVQEARLPRNKALEGKSIKQIAAETGRHVADAILDLALEEDLETVFRQVGTSASDESALPEFIRCPYSIIGLSDAGAHMGGSCGADFGTNFLRLWVRERGVVSLEEGVRRLSFVPAHLVGLLDRGLLQVGMAGDAVVFDPETIGSFPGEMVNDVPGGSSRMVKRARGVDYVIVNGEVLVDHGKHTGPYPGQVLRSTRYAQALD